VNDDESSWRATRRRLNQTRAALTRTAVELYPEAVRVGDFPFLTSTS
jgi:hypothetical protein